MSLHNKDVMETLGEKDGNILLLENVKSGYGKKEILHGVSLAVRRRSITALIGPNGSGKSTILKTIFSLVKAKEGKITFDGISCIGSKLPVLIRRGLVFVPQGNRVFPDLTVKQNIEVSLGGLNKLEIARRIEELLRLFPSLKERMRQEAGSLSGGEKQQLALMMGQAKRPKMLLLDEPSLGLAPNLLDDVFKRLKEINQIMGVSILLVEQKVRKALQISDWVYGLRLGEIVMQGNSDEIGTPKKLQNLFLGEKILS